MWVPDLGRDAGPKYVALANAIAEGARSGSLVPGTRLPPQRALATRLGMNLSTVSKAYDLAAEMGVVAGEVGRGTFVRMLSAPERIPWPKGAGGDGLDMSSNFPFPSMTSGELAESLQALASLPFSADLLKYHPNSAHPGHLAAGAAWMAGLGLETTGDRLLITSGAIHGIFVSLLATARPGDPIFLEEYTSPAIIGACRTLGLRATALPLDAEGIRPDALEAAAKRERPKALVVVPNLQNPTLAIMSLTRRKEIVEIARRHGFVLIEDEVYGPLLGDKDRQVPLAALAPERTCFCSSLSKSVAPGLRVGFLTVPASLRADALNAIRVSTWMTSPLLAQLAANWIGDGMALRLVDRHRAITRRRQQIAREILQDFALVAHDAALHLLLMLPEPWRAGPFAAHLQSLGVAVLPSSEMAVEQGARQSFVRLSLCNIEKEGAVRKALEICRAALQGA
jgi:DNA-binding transcriptional MocR family regulator